MHGQQVHIAQMSTPRNVKAHQGARALEATMEETVVGEIDFACHDPGAWKLALLKIAEKSSIKYVSFPHHQDALLEFMCTACRLELQ